VKKLYLLLLACWLCTSLQAQRFGFLSWSTSEGLAQSQVRAIEQDHLGYLWIGTLGGVSRFDGQKFTNFSKQDGLLNNQVNTIFQAENRDLVFGSIGGLTFFDGRKFTRAPFDSALASTQVNHMIEREGLLMVATERGLLSWDGQNYQSVFDTWEERRLHIKRMLISEKGMIVCAKSGVFLWTEKRVEKLISNQDLGANLMDASFQGENRWLEPPSSPMSIRFWAKASILRDCFWVMTEPGSKAGTACFTFKTKGIWTSTPRKKVWLPTTCER
jgi:ligand-binding sensor domain-containing protein